MPSNAERVNDAPNRPSPKTITAEAVATRFCPPLHAGRPDSPAARYRDHFDSGSNHHRQTDRLKGPGRLESGRSQSSIAPRIPLEFPRCAPSRSPRSPTSIGPLPRGTPDARRSAPVSTVRTTELAVSDGAVAGREDNQPLLRGPITSTRDNPPLFSAPEAARNPRIAPCVIRAFKLKKSILGRNSPLGRNCGRAPNGDVTALTPFPSVVRKVHVGSAYTLAKPHLAQIKGTQ